MERVAERDVTVREATRLRSEQAAAIVSADASKDWHELAQRFFGAAAHWEPSAPSNARVHAQHAPAKQAQQPVPAPPPLF